MPAIIGQLGLDRAVAAVFAAQTLWYVADMEFAMRREQQLYASKASAVGLR